MLSIRPILTLTLAGIALFPAAPAWGQGRRGMSLGHTKPVRPEKPDKAPKQPVREHNSPLEQFKKMSPQERQQQLAKLPPARAEELKRRLDLYDHMTPAQKEQADWFSHLPPDRQNAFRSAFQRFQHEPVERQQLMRQEMKHLRSLTDEGRQARLASPEFRGKYNPNEQQIVSEMAGLLPPKK